MQKREGKSVDWVPGAEAIYCGDAVHVVAKQEHEFWADGGGRRIWEKNENELATKQDGIALFKSMSFNWVILIY